MFRKRPEPNEVFTPRRTEVNPDMYIERPDLEKKLRRAARGTQHIIVFGDSGSGKTWLYKQLFKKEGMAFLTVDLSIALTEGLESAFKKALPNDEWSPIKKTVSGELNADTGFLGGKGGKTIEYNLNEKNTLDILLQHLSRKDGKYNFLVFDNFERISKSPETLNSIASLIIRLDHESFSKFGVKFLFVGVTADMKELVAHFDQAETVANRITGIPEVERLSDEEATKLIKRGLFEKLQITYLQDHKSLIDRIIFLSYRNAQQLHEFCYEIACEAQENNWVLTQHLVQDAEKAWFENSLALHDAQIESRMNKKETKIQRRNQVLYCIGMSEFEKIKTNDIDSMVRTQFPESATVDQLGIDQILSGLSDEKNPILIKNPNESSYRISHPKLRMALRYKMQNFAPVSRENPVKPPSD